MWSSILAAQDIVRQGCRRRMGNGDSTMVWKVPLLPSVENGFLTTGMPEQPKDITVSSLMKAGGNEWG